MDATTTPHPDCPMAARPHGEHVFRIFGTMSPLDGASVDCAGLARPVVRFLAACDLKGGDRIRLRDVGDVEVFDTEVFNRNGDVLVRYLTHAGIMRSAIRGGAQLVEVL